MHSSCHQRAPTNGDAVSLNPGHLALRPLLAEPLEKLSMEQRRALFGVFRHHDAEFAELNKKIDAAWHDWPYPPTTLVLQQRAKPRVTHVFKRGDRFRPEEE